MKLKSIFLDISAILLAVGGTVAGLIPIQEADFVARIAGGFVVVDGGTWFYVMHGPRCCGRRAWGCGDEFEI